MERSRKRGFGFRKHEKIVRGRGKVVARALIIFRMKLDASLFRLPWKHWKVTSELSWAL